MALGLMEAAQDDLNEVEGGELGKFETVKLVWKGYIPAGLVGLGSIAAIVGATTIHSRRNAAMTAAYMLTERAYTKYKDQVVETFGEKKEEEIRSAIGKKQLEESPPHEVVVVKDGKTLVLESRSGRYFYSDKEAVRKAQNDINEQIFNSEYASLNDFYRLLGLPSTTDGEAVGFTHANTLSIAYSYAGSAEGEPCMVIDYHEAPIANYHKFW